MRAIKKFFLFIYNDLKSDFETIVHIYKKSKNNEPFIDKEKAQIFLKEIKKAPSALLRESWYWVMAVIFAFAMGSIVGMEYCEMECHNFIVEEYWNNPSISNCFTNAIKEKIIPGPLFTDNSSINSSIKVLKILDISEGDK